MNFEEALRDELSQINGLTNKVFPLQAPEETKAPYAIYVSSDSVLDKSFEGYSDSGVISCEINILQNSYSGLKRLSKDVIGKIVSFQGRELGTSGPFIKDITYQTSPEIYEKEVALYRSVIDIKVRI
jgi:hypothetical protein